MTVQELIDKLSEIPDKNLHVVDLSDSHVCSVETDTDEDGVEVVILEFDD